MAKRRMFSLDIVDSDRFLEMPQTAQNLYFALGMRADDDGFVSSPNKIVKIIGANSDDFNILLAKSFVMKFDSGIMVITHWRMHNYIKKDRYTGTIYKLERSMLRIGKNKEYIYMDTKCIQNVSSLEPQDRLGKNSLVEIIPSINHISHYEIDRLKQQIYLNISYDILCKTTDKELLDELVTIMIDTISCNKEFVKISNQDIPFSVVKDRLLHIDDCHIEYVIECFKKNKTKVNSIKSYLLACLYNAPATINSYYTAEVNHDLYGK